MLEPDAMPRCWQERIKAVSAFPRGARVLGPLLAPEPFRPPRGDPGRYTLPRGDPNPYARYHVDIRRDAQRAREILPCRRERRLQVAWLHAARPVRDARYMHGRRVLVVYMHAAADYLAS